VQKLRKVNGSISQLQKLAALGLFFTHTQCVECGRKLLQVKNNKMQKRNQKFSFMVT